MTRMAAPIRSNETEKPLNRGMESLATLNSLLWACILAGAASAGRTSSSATASLA